MGKMIQVEENLILTLLDEMRAFRAENKALKEEVSKINKVFARKIKADTREDEVQRLLKVNLAHRMNR